MAFLARANAMSRIVQRCLVPVDADPDGERAAGFRRRLGEARELVRRLPLIHRTGKDDASSWASILDRGELRPGDAENAHEARVWEGKVCTFVGTATYPAGARVAFVFSKSALHPTDTATPFDTGGLAAFTRTPGEPAPLGDAAATAKLEEWVVAADDLAELAAHHIASSMRDPADYCRRLQHTSPDWLPPHGLESAAAPSDRRVWNVEVQHHRAVPTAPDRGLARIVVDSRDLAATIERHSPAHEGLVQFVEDGDYAEESVEDAYVRALSEVRLG